MPIIDVHTHMFTRRWLELLRAHGDPYGVAVRPDGRDEIYRGRTPVVFPQPGHFDYDIRIEHDGRAGIDVSIVSLTCPNVYWGAEAVSVEAARESNASMAEARARLPGTGSVVHLAPVAVPGPARSRSSRGRATRCRRRDGPRQRGRPEPDRAMLRADLGRDRPAGLAGPRPPGRAAGRRPHGHGRYDLSWSVGFMFDTTLAITRMIFDGFLDRYPEPQAHRRPRWRGAAVSRRAVREGRRGRAARAGAG